MNASYSFNNRMWDGVTITTKGFIQKLLTIDPIKRLSAAEALSDRFFKENS